MSKASLPLISDADLHSHIAETVQQLNSEITPDNPIAPYLEAYNDMFKKFDEAYERNLKLVHLCHEMNSTVILNANKISDILKYTSETNSRIESLKAEYEKARLKLKASTKGAEEKRAEFDRLRQEYNEIKQAIQPPEEVLQQIQETEQNFANLQEQIDNTNQLLSDLKKENEWLLSEFSKMQSELEVHKSNKKMTRKEKEEVNNEISKTENHIQELTDEKNSYDKLIEEAHNKIDSLKRSLLDFDIQTNSLITETNNIKAKITKIPKEMREQRKLLEANLEQKEFFDKQITKKTDLLEDLKQELQEISKDEEKNIAEFKTLTEQRRKNQQEKKLLTEKNSKLRIQLLNLQFANTKKKNENRTVNHVLMQEKVVYSNQKKDYQEEIQTTQKMNEVTLNYISETTQKKQTISDMQEKISSIQSDIINRTNEMNDLDQKTSTLEDKILNNTIENEKEISKHKALKQRIEEQTELINKLTQEKNSFKRQYENVTSQYNELRTQYDQLTSTIEMMTDKVDKIVEETKMSKVLKEEAKIAAESLEKMRVTAMQGIERSINSTQKLKAERRTLSCVIEDTEKRHKQQENEYRLMAKNYIMLQNQYELKNRKKDQLSSEKESIEAFRHKSEIMFNEKMNEIFDLREQLQVQQEKQKVLQSKVEYVNELIKERNRCLDMLQIEKKRKMSLYNLSMHQIHISPYSIDFSSSSSILIENEEALNHIYAINLSQRIVDAMQELDKLRKERDELEKKLKEKKEKLSSDLTSDDVKKYIDAYNRDLKSKDEEIEKCKELIQKNAEKTTQSKEKNDQTRLAVSHRKTVTHQLRQTNIELRRNNIRNRTINQNQLMRQPSNSLDLSFITEPSSFMYQQSSARIRNQRDQVENEAQVYGQIKNVPRLKLNRKINEGQPPPMIQSQRYQLSLNPKIRVPMSPKSPRNMRRYAMK